MVKKVISLSLGEETINEIDKYARALGMNRSEFLDWYILKMTIRKDIVKQIRDAQNKLFKELFE